METNDNPIRAGPFQRRRLAGFNNCGLAVKRWETEKTTAKNKKDNKTMRQERVYTDYGRWSDDALATLAGRTVEFLTDNAAFPDPQP
ncbi:MAG TPA: hypothetical protein VNQ55_09480, partial [Parapedobacter sp.]|nr:hypothetical protein [Parapedobacter sp.]